MRQINNARAPPFLPTLPSPDRFPSFQRSPPPPFLPTLPSRPLILSPPSSLVSESGAPPLQLPKERNVPWAFLGCPGIGNGTDASRLSRLLDVPHIATGDLVREELNSTGDLSQQDLSSMVDERPPLGDKLILRGVIFHGFHGAKPEEKILGQKFLIDIDAWLDLQKAGESDSLRDTVSYGDIYRIVKNIVEGPSHDLLESVAHQISTSTFEKHPQISAIRIKIGKPHVAVPGAIDYLGIEIFRHNKKAPST